MSKKQVRVYLKVKNTFLRIYTIWVQPNGHFYYTFVITGEKTSYHYPEIPELRDGMHMKNIRGGKMYSKFGIPNIDESSYISIDYHGLFKSEIEKFKFASTKSVRNPCVILDFEKVKGDEFQMPILFGKTENFNDIEKIKN